MYALPFASIITGITGPNGFVPCATTHCVSVAVSVCARFCFFACYVFVLAARLQRVATLRFCTSLFPHAVNVFPIGAIFIARRARPELLKHGGQARYVFDGESGSVYMIAGCYSVFFFALCYLLACGPVCC